MLRIKLRLIGSIVCLFACIALQIPLQAQSCIDDGTNSISMRSNTSYFVRMPPIITSMLVSAPRSEVVQVPVKSAFAGRDIRLKVVQTWLENDAFRSNQEFYDLYDDGTHGDIQAGDLILTTDQIPLKYSLGLKQWEVLMTRYFIQLMDADVVVDENVFDTYYVHVTPTFIQNLQDPPMMITNADSTFVQTDRFIYSNNFEVAYRENPDANYDPENTFWDLENIDNRLQDLWSLNALGVEGKAFKARTEVSLQSHQNELTTDKIHLSLPQLLERGAIGLNHEILHRWIPDFYIDLENKYFNNQDVSHHPIVFRDQSAFFSPDLRRKYYILCKDQMTIPDAGLSYADFLFQDCTDNGDDLRLNRKFSDLELFIMDLLPIDSVQLPIIYIEDPVETERLHDPVTEDEIGVRVYYEGNQLLEIGADELLAAKDKLNERKGESTSGDSLNLVINFVGNRSLSHEELMMLDHIAKDVTNKGTHSKDDLSTALTYFEATGGRGRLSSIAPIANCLPANLAYEVEKLPTCAGASDAIVTLKNIPASAMVSWENGESGIQAMQLGSGTHFFTISGIGSCNVRMQVEVDELDPLTATIDVVEDTVSTATALVSGGMGPYQFQWDDPAGQTTGTATGLVKGTYNVEITDANGCTINRTVEVATTTRVVDQSLENKLTVFPNPVSHKLHVLLDQAPSFERVEIYQMDGRRIRHFDVKNLALLEVDLSSFGGGNYILRALTPTHEVSLTFLKIK